MGRPNVGKSTLLNALVGDPIAIVSHHPQTTRETVRGVRTEGDAQYVLLDTPGLHKATNRLGERMNASAVEAAREADVVVFLVAAPREDAPRSPRSGSSPGPTANPDDLAFAAQLPAIPCVLAITKIDRVMDKAALLPLIASLSAGREFAATVPISARRRDGLDELLAEIRGLLPAQPFLFEEDTLSDQPERFFVAEFVREQILRHTRQEVPHGVAVVIDRFEDRPAAGPRIAATIHVARESHKKILVGRGGQMLKAIGVRARARIERMLARHVDLRLHVRATPGWMDDEARLKELVGR